MGAIDEGIPIPPIVGIEHFRLAFATRGQVRWNTGTSFSLAVTAENAESSRFCAPQDGNFIATVAVKAGSARKRAAKILPESLEPIASPFDFDGHTVRCVLNPAVESPLMGYPIDEGAKTNSLDYPAYGDAPPSVSLKCVGMRRTAFRTRQAVALFAFG